MTWIWLGIFGTLALAIGGIPQVIKTFREGHAMGLSAGMIWSWLIGFSTLFTYVVLEHPEDYILLANYGFNFFVALVLLRYKYWPKEQVVP